MTPRSRRRAGASIPAAGLVVVAALAVCGGQPWPVAAQPENPVVWSFRAPENGGKVPAGGQTVIEVVATIEPGWHLYAITQPPGGPIATRISVPTGQLFAAAGPVTAPAPRREMDPNFEMETQF